MIGPRHLILDYSTGIQTRTTLRSPVTALARKIHHIHEDPAVAKLILGAWLFLFTINLSWWFSSLITFSDDQWAAYVVIHIRVQRWPSGCSNLLVFPDTKYGLRKKTSRCVGIQGTIKVHIGRNIHSHQRPTLFTLVSASLISLAPSVCQESIYRRILEGLLTTKWRVEISYIRW